jgi:hypothetical protein
MLLRDTMNTAARIEMFVVRLAGMSSLPPGVRAESLPHRAERKGKRDQAFLHASLALDAWSAVLAY